LPPGRSFYRIGGEVLVNGVVATLETFVPAQARIATGVGAEAIFVVGADAFLLRDQGVLELQPGGGGGGGPGGDNLLVQGLRLVTGRLLSVFGRHPHRLETGNGIMGIRGTGLYATSAPETSYVCTCYGTVEIGVQGAQEREAITSTHHSAPRYILSTPEGGRRIVPAPVVDHTDEELTLIEALVGRTPPFLYSGGGYDGLRHQDY
jgi:hypothetical protein